MSHTPEIVRFDQVSDEIVGVVVRCCGDPKTDSTLTLQEFHLMSAEKIDAEEEAFKVKVKNKHESMIAGKAYLAAKMAKQQT